MEVTLKIELTEQFLKDILVTICESGYYGIGYWATIGKITKGTPDDYTEVMIWNDGDDGEGDRKHKFKMGLEQIGKGIQLILSSSSKALSLHEKNIAIVAAAVANQDAGQIDADAADWIAQVSIFGRVIYG